VVQLKVSGPVRPLADAFLGIAGLELKIRPLECADVPFVLEIERLGYSHPWSEAVFKDCFQPHYLSYALVQGECICGYAVVNYVVDEAHLLNLCVHPEMRGKGAGRRLLRHVAAKAAADGMTQLMLEVRQSNYPASRLYEAEGFIDIGLRPDYYPGSGEREDARVMALRFA